MKRTCLQADTNTDEQLTCEFSACPTGWHLVEIERIVILYDPKENQFIK